MEQITHVHGAFAGKRGGDKRGPVLIKDVKTILRRSQTQKGEKEAGVGGKGFIDIISRDVARRQKSEGDGE